MSAGTGPADRTILIGSAVMIAALSAASFAIGPADAAPDIPGSTFATGAQGARAAYLVLQELGHEIVRSFEPATAIESEPSRTTLVLAAPVEGPSQGDRQALDAFLHDGGVVLAFGRSAAAFLPGVTMHPGDTSQKTLETFAASLPGRLTRGARELTAYRSSRPSLDPAYVPVYGGRDAPAVVTARLGAGQVIWCLDETLAQNGGITRGTSVQFITNAAGLPGSRRLLWDEYYHGQRRSFWSYVADTPLVWGAAQAGLIAVVAVVGISRRRGPVRARTVEPRTSPLEFIDTMGSLYERAGNRRAAVDAIRQSVRRRLALLVGLSPSAGDDQLAAAVAPRLGIDANEVRAVLGNSADALRRGVAGDQEAVSIVAELQELVRRTTRQQAGRTEREP